MIHAPVVRAPVIRAAIVAAAIALAFTGDAMAQEPPGGALDMVVIRDGNIIGSHRIAFHRDGTTLTVATTVAIKIKIAFFTVYRYRQQGGEVFRDGRLVSYDATVDDDGTFKQIKAEAGPKGLAVDGPAGKFIAPAGTMISGYWNVATVKQTRLIDATEGKLLKVAFTGGKAQTIEVAGRSVPARHYRMTGDLEREFWYDTAGRLLRMRSIARDDSVIVTEIR